MSPDPASAGLPRIMLAPNGARLTKADHPALPVTIPEIVSAALAGRAAGADGLHAHVRDAEGRHVLDAGLYAELLAELDRKTPGFPVQVTTEAVGIYSPAEQRALVERLLPRLVSIAFREIAAEPDADVTRRFFAFCAEAGCHVQHILYDLEDIARLVAAVDEGTIPREGLAVLLVLGRYTPGQVSVPADLDLPAAALLQALPAADWAVCAFGPRETECLVAAHRMGGKMRIGFENNLLQSDGQPAPDNAARVAELVAALRSDTAQS
ncbi:3-keto-5-aminohexanoate cleavage protein [Cereibacter sediminicola]|uniref:3-keto-5-aminohexanoate cleavage protein n=1 Tax=Cereibacter sediminicola TaxID=2584941 RepID=UPI0011A80EC9|nr:3-keto-5-aminohexanoate cleavage protein [Cereibacter sediminicola]